MHMLGVSFFNIFMHRKRHGAAGGAAAMRLGTRSWRCRVRYDVTDGGDEAVANNGGGWGQEHGGTK